MGNQVNLYISYAILNNKLLMIRETDPDIANSILRFAAWPLDEKGVLTWQEIPIPINLKYNGVDNGYHTYNPTGFVVKSRKKNRVTLLCKETKCDRLPVIDNGLDTNLIVDGEKRQLINLEHKKYSSSSLNIFLIPY